MQEVQTDVFTIEVIKKVNQSNEPYEFPTFVIKNNKLILLIKSTLNIRFLEKLRIHLDLITNTSVDQIIKNAVFSTKSVFKINKLSSKRRNDPEAFTLKLMITLKDIPIFIWMSPQFVCESKKLDSCNKNKRQDVVFSGITKNKPIIKEMLNKKELIKAITTNPTFTNTIRIQPKV